MTLRLLEKLHLGISLLVMANIGMLIIVALYYIVTQTTDTMNNAWHWLISNSEYRHDVRNAGEGMLGGYLAQMVIWDHYRNRNGGFSKIVDRVTGWFHLPTLDPNDRMSGKKLSYAWLAGIVAAIPGFIAGIFIVKAFSHHAHLVPQMQTASESLWHKTRAIWTEKYSYKVIGYAGSIFFGRFALRGFFDDVQLWFAERRVLKAKFMRQRVHLGLTTDGVETVMLPLLRWWQPPPYRSRILDVYGHRGEIPMHLHGPGTDLLVRAAGVICVGLAIFGWVVLAFIA